VARQGFLTTGINENYGINFFRDHTKLTKAITLKIGAPAILRAHKNSMSFQKE
jgi:hypothetical protein